MSLSSAYEEILADYIAELGVARDEAMAWWARLIARKEAEGRSRPEAEHSCRMRWPAGPASYPRVIEVYRRHHLAVREVNQDYLDRNETDDGFNDPDLWDETDEEANLLLEPQALLFEELGRRDADLYSLMRFLVFIPMGFDREGVLR